MGRSEKLMLARAEAEIARLTRELAEARARALEDAASVPHPPIDATLDVLGGISEMAAYEVGFEDGVQAMRDAIRALAIANAESDAMFPHDLIARHLCYAACSRGYFLDPENGCTSICACPSECQSWRPFMDDAEQLARALAAPADDALAHAFDQGGQEWAEANMDGMIDEEPDATERARLHKALRARGDMRDG